MKAVTKSGRGNGPAQMGFSTIYIDEDYIFPSHK